MHKSIDAIKGSSLVFPIVKTPQTLLDIRNDFIRLPEVDELPVEEFFEPKRKEARTGGIIIIGISCLVLIVSIAQASGTAAIWAFIFIIIGLMWNSVDSSANNSNEKEYRMELTEHKNKINLFLQQKNELSELREISGDPSKKSNYIKEQKQNFFSSAVRPTQNVPAKKGVSEDYFYNFLQKYFPGEIYNDMYIKPSDSRTMPYVPDFVYAHSTQNFFIDIEIDEPYDLMDRKAVHYRVTNNEGMNSTADDLRNDFFLSCNWLVVRFSEEQIIKQPIACCYFVARTIAYYFGETEYFKYFSYNDIKIGYPLHEYPVWSYEEAELMSRQETREKLLKEIGIIVRPQPVKTIKPLSKIDFDEDDLPF